MSECYCFDDIGINPDEWNAYTGVKQWNAVYTIQLGELIDCGVFDWNSDILIWRDAAYDESQYERICKYFIERFYFREISIEPYREWAMTLHRKLVYELMPKYKTLYARELEGVNPFAASNEYYKNRTIESKYPETLLSANADYITDGKDEEFQRIKEGDYIDQLEKYAAKLKAIDQLLLDELESMFICVYTANVNATW